MRLREGAQLRLPETRISEAGVQEHDRRPFAPDVAPEAHRPIFGL
jgi:hypothetical protein